MPDNTKGKQRDELSSFHSADTTFTNNASLEVDCIAQIGIPNGMTNVEKVSFFVLIFFFCLSEGLFFLFSFFFFFFFYL